MPLSINALIAQIVAAQPKKPGPIHDALQAIQNWASAGLVDADIAAGAAIAISKTALGIFSAWANWTPGWTGFSVNPTLLLARWMRLGPFAIIVYADNSGGTSNSTALTITGLPVTPQQTMEFPLMTARDASGIINTGIVQTGALTTVLTCYPAHTGGTWTPSGTKGAGYFVLVVEV